MLLSDIEVNSYRKKFLEEGIIQIKSLFKDEDLFDLENSAKKCIDKASKGKWEFIKIYNEYPFFFNKINLFGVTSPLNKSLVSNTYDNFQKLKYKDNILKILDWKNFQTPLIRLHTNSDFYNYQGNWHRDDDKFPSPNSIQLIIYLKDEKGFRIVPKNKNHALRNYEMSTVGQPDHSSENYQGFTKLSKDMYTSIEASKGDIVIFESGLLHQGFIKKKRLHFHLRHVKFDQVKDISKNDQFNFSEQLKGDYDLDVSHPTPKFNLTKKTFKEKLKRVRVFICYFFPRIKSIKKNISKKYKESIFHSTIWQ